VSAHSVSGNSVSGRRSVASASHFWSEDAMSVDSYTDMQGNVTAQPSGGHDTDKRDESEATVTPPATTDVTSHSAATNTVGTLSEAPTPPVPPSSGDTIASTTPRNPSAELAYRAAYELEQMRLLVTGQRTIIAEQEEQKKVLQEELWQKNETITRLGIERDALASRCHALEEILGDVTMKVKGEAAHISTWVANVEALQRERDQAVAANNILSKQIERLEELLCHVIEVAREEIHGRDRIDDNEYE